MNKVIKELIQNKSPYKYAMISALILGVGSITGITVDIGWLIGDMLIKVHTHHWFVLVGLVFADIISIIGTFFLVKSLSVYTNTHDRKVSDKKRTKTRVSKQAAAIMALNHRIDELEELLSKGK